MNSEDGCVKYQDIYVRAIGLGDEALRIYISHNANEIYSPMFEIYNMNN